MRRFIFQTVIALIEVTNKNKKTGGKVSYTIDAVTAVFSYECNNARKIQTVM